LVDFKEIVIDWFIMAKRKLDDDNTSGGLWVTSQGTQTESDSRPEKKQKTKDMRLPRFVVTMVSMVKGAMNRPKHEFYRQETKTAGKFSILIRGEENALDAAIKWIMEYVPARKLAKLEMPPSGDVSAKTVYLAKLNDAADEHAFNKVDGSVWCYVDRV
jgi:hypothetical protein